MGTTLNEKKFSGYKMAITAGFAQMFIICTSGAIGLFMSAMASDTDLGINIGNIAIMNTISDYVAVFLNIVVMGWFLTKASPRISIVIGGTINVLRWILLANAHSLGALLLAGFMSGLMAAFAGNAASGTIMSQWFVDKRAKVTAIIFTGAAAAGLVWTALFGNLISSYGWRVCSYIMAAINLMGVLAVALIIRTPEQLGQKPLGWEHEQQMLSDAKAAEEKAAVTGLGFKNTLKAPAFWVMAVGMFLMGMLITGYKVYLASLISEVGGSMKLQTNMTLVLSVAGFIMILGGGMLAEKIKVKWYFRICMVAFIAGVLVCLRWLSDPSVLTLGIVAALLVGIAYPISNAMVTLVSTYSFGRKDFAKILAPLTGAHSLGMGTSSLIVKAAVSATGSIATAYKAYLAAAIAALVLISIAMAISPLGKRKKTET